MKVHQTALLIVFLAACKQATPAEPMPEPAPLTHPQERHYGYWGLNGYVSPEGLADVQSRLGASIFHTSTRSPNYALRTLLPMAQAADMRVTLRLTGDHQHYTDAHGDFDVEAWKRQLEPWAAAASELAPYIEDGTLFAHMLLDDIRTWEGTNPTGDELDEMARASKEALPGLATFVREHATRMPIPSSGQYKQVDAIVNQYRHREGDVQEYTRKEVARARTLDVRIIHGLNIANGGDGSSGQPGWQQGRFAMSADEIRHYGAVLASPPDVSLFLNWEYDGEERWSDGSVGSDWFDKPELQAALVELGERIKAHPGPPLVKQ